MAKARDAASQTAGDGAEVAASLGDRSCLRAVLVLRVSMRAISRIAKSAEGGRGGKQRDGRFEVVEKVLEHSLATRLHSSQRRFQSTGKECKMVPTVLIVR